MRGLGLLLLLGVTACQIWRGTPPKPASQIGVQIPAYEHRALANGLKVYLQPDPYLAMVSVQLVVRGGEAAVPQQQAGLMQVLYGMLTEDAELTQELDALGATVRLRLAPDGAAIEATVAADDALRALQLLAKAVREPRLDQVSFDRVRKRRLAAIFDEATSPEERATDILRAAIYGPAHPINATGRRMLTSLSQLQLADVVAAHQRFIGPKNVAVVMVGRVPLVVGFAWAQKYLGDWSAAAEEPQVAPPLPAQSHAMVQVVSARSLPGTLVLVGGRLALARPEDTAATQTAVRLLGHRVAVRLRRAGFLVAGAETSISIERHAFGAHYVFRTTVRPESTAAALKAIQSELTGRITIHIKPDADPVSIQLAFLNAGYLNDQLHHASKLGEIATLIHAFRGLSEVGRNAAALHLRKLKEDYFIRLLDSLNALTHRQVNDAVSSCCSPEQAHIVLAGNPSVIEAQLRQGDFGKAQRLPLE